MIQDVCQKDLSNQTEQVQEFGSLICQGSVQTTELSSITKGRVTGTEALVVTTLVGGGERSVLGVGG